MAKVIELEEYRKSKGLGQAMRLGPLSIPYPIRKIRLHFNLLPDVTVDATAPPSGVGNIIRPRATILLSTGQAIMVDPYDPKEKIKKADPRIFDTPTVLDSILNFGIIPFTLVTVGAGYLLYKLVKR